MAFGNTTIAASLLVATLNRFEFPQESWTRRFPVGPCAGRCRGALIELLETPYGMLSQRWSRNELVDLS